MWEECLGEECCHSFSIYHLFAWDEESCFGAVVVYNCEDCSSHLILVTL